MAPSYWKEFARIDRTLARQLVYLERPSLPPERRLSAQKNLMKLMYRRDAIFGEFTRVNQMRMNGTVERSTSWTNGETLEVFVSKKEGKSTAKDADQGIKDVNKEKNASADKAPLGEDNELNEELEESFPGSDAPSATRRSETK